MKEEKIHNLRRAIGEMKTTKAPDVWNSINDRLHTDANRDALSQAIEELDVKEAPDIWAEVESSLDERKTVKRPFWYAAAAISLLLVSYLFYNQLSQGQTEEIITYSTEEVEYFEVAGEMEGFESNDDEILQYVHQNCKRLIAKCEDPEFKGLLETYMELNDAKEEIEAELDKNNNQPQLMKYLIRVEKNQTQVGKDMLKKLKYS